MTTSSGFRRFSGFTIVAAAIFSSVSCGDVVRTGRSPVYVIVDSIAGAPGSNPTQFVSNLLSDVQVLIPTTVNGQQVLIPSFFNDLARVTFRLGQKNSGTPSAPIGPSELNAVTIQRYHVDFKRADGRNTQGVDVPYSFDGAFTVTIPINGTVSQSFDIVRHQAKLEPPLKNLAGLGSATFITTIAEVTFWGHDQAGNEVQAFANITVQFGDFADEE